MLKTRVLILVIFILSLGTIYSCFRNRQLKQQLENYTPQVISKIDTVYLDKPFKVEAPYKEASIPSKVTVYNKGLEKDTSSLQSKDSVVQFKLDKSNLNLTLYNPLDSTVHTDKYDLNLDKYRYIYSNGIITQQKKLNIKLSPYIQTKIRPINKLYDLGGGISLKTNHFTYSIGLNLSYYPRLSDKLQKDLEISVTYNY